MRYAIGLVGMWIFTDGIISIKLYLGTEQTWTNDHSIRIIRCLCGVFLMVVGAIG